MCGGQRVSTLTPKQKSKRKTYTDDFRANTVLMLEAAGYPDQKGALTAVAKKVKAPPRTISRWFNKEQNPPPDRLVKEKRGELVERLDDMAHMLLDAMGIDIQENGVDAVRAATALGIVFDKLQLLSGKPTDITEVNVTDDRERILARLAKQSGGYVTPDAPPVGKQPIA